MPRRVTAFVSATYLFNPESARLGRIVLNPQEPLETYFDVFPNQDELSDTIHISPSIKLACTYNSNKNKSLGASLVQLFSGLFSSTSERGMNLEGETKRYQLGNAEILFRKACTEEQRVREWLQENVINAGVSAYMIVGYHTIKNPKITSGNKLGRLVGVGADDSTILAGTALGLPNISGGGNLRSSNSFTIQNISQQKISADGEGVWAVQYRKVVYKVTSWLSKGEIKLKESQWKMLCLERGQKDSGESLVETYLGDAAEPEEDDEGGEEEEEEAAKAPEFYFEISDDSGEVVEEFVLFHDDEGTCPPG